MNQNYLAALKIRNLKPSQNIHIKRKKNRPKREREVLMRKIQIRSLLKGKELALTIIILQFPRVMNGNMKERC
jgi:hypothetical protein